MSHTPPSSSPDSAPDLRRHTPLGVFLRGVCMGIADLIPGVSGGTIAFISGIYPRLLGALAVYTQPPFWRALRRFDVRELWRITDAPFVLALLGGILAAIALFADFLKYSLETAPHLLLGFFFGLVLASIVAVGRHVRGPSPRHFGYAAISAAITLRITTFPPESLTILFLECAIVAILLIGFASIPISNTKKAVLLWLSGPLIVGILWFSPEDFATLSDKTAPLTLPPTLPILFIGGAIAICAMILPGISGSYILLILGLYPAIITAVSERDFVALAVFAAGCGAGLLLFARALAALLRRHAAATLLALLGVMVGALPKLWPWKESGEGVKMILQPNVWPAEFAAQANNAGSSDIALVIALAAFGMAAVFALDRIARQQTAADPAP